MPMEDSRKTDTVTEDDKVTNLQQQIHHWQQKFKEEEQHNRELQQQLDTAMADRSKLCSDLRVKTLLMEDTCKELEQLKACMNSGMNFCKCKQTPLSQTKKCTASCEDSSLQARAMQEQPPTKYGEDASPQSHAQEGPPVIYVCPNHAHEGPPANINIVGLDTDQGGGWTAQLGKEDPKALVNLLMIERQIQWALHQNIAQLTEQLEEKENKLKEIEEINLTIVESSQSGENIKEKLSFYDNELEASEVNGQWKERELPNTSTTELASLKDKKQSVQDQISEMNMSLQALCKEVKTKETRDHKDRQLDDLETKCEEIELSRQLLRRQVEEKDKKIKATNRRNNDLSREVDALQNELRTLKQEQKNLKKKLNTMQIYEDEFNGEVYVTKSLLKMSEKMKIEIIDMIQDLASQQSDFHDICQTVTDECEKLYGDYWKCVIGRNFTCNVGLRHARRCIYYTVNGVNVLLYQNDNMM